MPSGKNIALHDYFEADHNDLTPDVRDVSTNFEHARIDVSGFSASGKDEFLPGNTTQEVTVEFYNTSGSNEVWQTLYPLFRDKSTFPIAWRKDMNNNVGATNPELRGNVKIFTWPETATRGEVRTLSVTFLAADDDGLEFFYT